jgi:hypothetical protein
MDISSVSGSAMTPEVQAQYAVKCMKMAQESTEVVGNLIQDTVEFSNEAMQRFMAERAQA